jgi:hypothetical protein
MHNVLLWKAYILYIFRSHVGTCTNTLHICSYAAYTFAIFYVIFIVTNAVLIIQSIQTTKSDIIGEPKNIKFYEH